MGAALGKVSVETPKHTVIHQADDYEVWQYPAAVAATVHARDLPPASSSPDEGNNSQPLTDEAFNSAAFRTLARYIGVFSTPENIAATASMTPNDDKKGTEKVAMTAPVVMTPAEKVAMTAPVVMTPPEKVSVTAPVVLSSNESHPGSTTNNTDISNTDNRSMKFLLPSKYRTISEAPTPTNAAVKLEFLPAGRCEAVVCYSGNLRMESARVKAEELLNVLDRDGVRVVGQWTAQGYNPPFTPPWLKRNEIHVPVDGSSLPGDGKEKGETAAEVDDGA